MCNFEPEFYADKWATMTVKTDIQSKLTQFVPHKQN